MFALLMRLEVTGVNRIVGALVALHTLCRLIVDSFNVYF